MTGTNYILCAHVCMATSDVVLHKTKAKNEWLKAAASVVVMSNQERAAGQAGQKVPGLRHEKPHGEGVLEAAPTSLS